MNRLKMTVVLTVLSANNTPATYLKRAIRGHLAELATDEINARRTTNFIYGIENIDGPFNIESLD